MSYSLFDYSIKVFKDERDNDFGAFIEEIPEVSAFGETPGEAINELKTAYELWLESCQEEGYPVSEPFNVRGYSGKFVLRVPKSLHKKLVEKANEENVSLNHEVNYCITRGLASL